LIVSLPYIISLSSISSAYIPKVVRDTLAYSGWRKVMFVKLCAF